MESLKFLDFHGFLPDLKNIILKNFGPSSLLSVDSQNCENFITKFRFKGITTQPQKFWPSKI